MDNTRIKGADFVRAISTVVIVIFHFFSAMQEVGKEYSITIYTSSGINWGSVFVTTFFVLSGAMLYHSNPEIKGLNNFYYKRWKSIFPMFYLVYLVCYIPDVIKHGSFFYKGNPSSFVLTIMGMDGYFNYKMTTYYILGEWFLGAIIMLYILYPLMLKLIKKPLISSLAITALFIWQTYTDIFEIDSMRNLISCIFSFWIGMIFMKYYEMIKEKRLMFIVASLIMSIILMFVPIPVDKNITVHLAGFFVFITLMFVGDILMNKAKILNLCLGKISMISYAVFLVHHRVVYKVVLYLNEISIVNIILFVFITVLLSIIGAFVAYYANYFIMKLFSKMVVILKRRN